MDNTTAHEDKSDSDHTTSLLSDLTHIEVECKIEPPDHELIEESPTYDEISFHIPIFAPKIKNPIILLERCDNIWKTLQLIKTVQPEQITLNEDFSKEEEKEKTHKEEDEEGEGEEKEKEEEKEEEEEEEEEEEKEEKKEHLNETLQSAHYTNKQSTKKNKNTVLPPFKFSVQSTRKVYPCLTCGKQYMERRSLRKHLWKIHGVFLPLIRKRVKTSANSTQPSSKPTQLSSKSTCSKPISSKLTDKKDLISSDGLLKKENISESHHNDESLHRTTTAAKAKVTKQSAVDSYIKCPLCKRKVSSLRKHFICYHKIGGNSSLMKQLESPQIENKVENKVTPKKKSSLSNILSGKSPQTSSTQKVQDSRIMDNKETVTKKRKYTLSSQENKRLKIDESLAREENKRRTQSINVTSYKCQICFGLYASQHSLYKHTRIHRIRGETKENFHKFKCRYLNSPLNQKYQLLQSSAKSTIITPRNNDSISPAKRSLQPSNSKENQLSLEKTFCPNTKINPSGRNMTKDSKTICSCGRSFRNPHTLFIHKEQCNFDTQETKKVQTRKRSYDDKDAGNGINITIKKRNDSYEIVGKDPDENRPEKSIQVENSFSIVPKSSDHTTKDATNTSTKPEVDIIKPPEYSKDHSIMKLKIAEEDLVVDIEDDVAVNTDKTDTVEQVTASEYDRRYLSQQDQTREKKDTETKVPDEMLKQVSEDVCEVLTERRVKNTLEDKKVLKDKVQENSQAKEQKNNPVKSQEIHQENKMELRSYKRSQSANFENFDDTFTGRFDAEFDGPQLYMTKIGSLKCGYCNEQFDTTNSYDNHQCTVKEGKPFDHFSLYLPCFYCSEVLNTYQEYDQHMRIKHLDDMYNCYQCPERFRHDKARLNHLQNYHDDMSCRVCNKKMNTSTKILHEGYHFGFGFPCHKCKKAYISKRNLYYHKSTIHPAGGDNLLTCSICLKSIKLKTFRGHMATHKHNECHFCGKMFSNRTGIEYHTMIYHGTHSKLKCNICGTRFINKNQFDKHEKMGVCRNNSKKVKSRAYYTNARNY